MSIDAIIMAILSYGFFVGGFVYGLIKVLQSDRNQKKAQTVWLVFRFSAAKQLRTMELTSCFALEPCNRCSLND